MLIKVTHTIAFFSISRTVVAALVAVGESALFGSNNLVCPLTPLAEELGAARGSVTDIYLPRWLSLRVPLIGGGGLLLGLLLNLRAARRRH